VSDTVPAAELEALAQAIRAQPLLMSPDDLAAEYGALGLEVLRNAIGHEVGDLAKRRLRAREPFSVIRIGDGEANILASGDYGGTPALNRQAVREILAMQEDRFELDEFWTGWLRELMLGAIAQADVVGVLGVGRLTRGRDPAKRAAGFAQALPAKVRGTSGQWRAREFMLQLARRGALRGKTIASAHLYFGILDDLAGILAHAERTILVTRSSEVHRAMQRRYPQLRIDRVAVGIRPGLTRDRPDFLLETLGALPQELRGCLCLVGAGIWAEPYCAWIRQRGGVAIDVGSGFDLLEGRATRPAHAGIKLDTYKL
jgi:hypothetical protein